MQRPPIACRRVAHSLHPRNATPPQHVWISDELLAVTVNRFFRTGCVHQKRHGSHVPGPLEARKRGVKRQMTVQAHVPQFDLSMPLFTLRTLFGKRRSPETSWRYEPPSMPASSASSREAPEAQHLHSTASVGNTIHEAILHEPAAQETAPVKAAEQVLPESQQTTIDSIQGVDDPLVDADCFLFPLGVRESPSGFVDYRKYPQTAHLLTKIYKTTLQILDILQDGLPQTNEPEILSKYLETCIRLASILPERSRTTILPTKSRIATLEEVFRSAFTILGPEAPRLSVRILEHLIAQKWRVRPIIDWLARPYVPLPLLSSPDCTAFLCQLERMFAKYKLRPLRLNFVYHKLLAAEVSMKVLDERTSQNLELLKLLLYRAEWGKLLHQHLPGMEPDEVRALAQLADLLTDAIVQGHEESTWTNHQIVDCLNQLKASRPDDWQLVYSFVLPLVPAPFTSSVASKHQSSVNAEHDATAEQQERAIDLGAFLRGSAHPPPDLNTYLHMLRLQNILDLARGAKVLPAAYQGCTVEKLIPQEVEIIHQLAHQYSIEGTRSIHQNQRSLSRLYNYLKISGLPIGPLFTESLVRVFLTLPMKQNDFVSAKVMLWVCRVVEEVEGRAAAKRIATVFYMFKGDTIKQAQRRFAQLGGEGQARIKTFRQLNIPLWEEDTML